MFNLFKKEVTAKEYGHQMWLLCCDFAEQFCSHFEPQLKAAGYLRSQDESRRLMDETMHLHIWIVSCAFGAENHNVLEVVNNYAMNFITEQQGKHVSIRDRYALYYQAYSKDIADIQTKRDPWPRGLGLTALRCLVNYKSDSPAFIETEIQTAILGAINQIRQMREKVRISKP